MRNLYTAFFAATLALFGGISHAALVFGDPTDYNNSAPSSFVNATEVSNGVFAGTNGGKLEPLFGLSGCDASSSAAGVRISFTECVFHSTGFDPIGGAEAYQFNLTAGASGFCFIAGGYATASSAATFTPGVNGCVAAGQEVMLTFVAESVGARVFAAILNIYDGAATLTSASVLFNSPPPVPLPAAFAFMLTGLVGVRALKRRLPGRRLA